MTCDCYANQDTWRRPLNYTPHMRNTHTHMARTYCLVTSERTKSLPTFRHIVKTRCGSARLQPFSAVHCLAKPFSVGGVGAGWRSVVGRAWQVIWQTHFNLRIVCLSALRLSFVCPKTSWETCQRVLCRQQVFQLCCPALETCLFLVESLIKFLISEIRGAAVRACVCLERAGICLPGDLL